MSISSTITISEIKKLLVEEMENKKSYEANYDTICDVDNGNIYKGEEFIFMGSRKKVCTNCQSDIMEFLE